MADSKIKAWLDSKERDYNEGVKLYAEHPTALRMLVVNLQRKQTAQMEEKLVYVLGKALAADQDGGAETLKKKETTKPAPKKKGNKGKSVTEKAAKEPGIPKIPTPPAEPVPPMGDQPELPAPPAEEAKGPEPPTNPS